MAPDRTNPPFPAPEGATVAVVGAGRLGTALVTTLRGNGICVTGPLGRGERPEPCDAVLLSVPDSEIADAATTVDGAAPLVGHTSGATGLDALAGAGGAAFGLHPLQTFAGGEGPDRFQGAGCAVAGQTPAAAAFASALARRLGMHPFEVADEDRAAYHAAASIASNFLVTLEALAEEVAGGAGIEPSQARSLLAPLVRATVDNWTERGPQRALTGPVARGDRATVARQRAAVAATAPGGLALFDELVARTEALTSAEVAA
jgi:predicted short-subunit dehydrogenase-like oxidoreductase (DUF2520 family)